MGSVGDAVGADAVSMGGSIRRAIGEHDSPWPIVAHLTSAEEGQGSEGFIHFVSTVPAVLEALGDPSKLARRF